MRRQLLFKYKQVPIKKKKKGVLGQTERILLVVSFPARVEETDHRLRLCAFVCQCL